MLNMGMKKPKATSEATRGCRSFTPKSSNHFIGDLLGTRKHIGLQESRCCPSWQLRALAFVESPARRFS